jgi:hypothetical protein
MAPACGTSPWLRQVAGLVRGCRFERPVRGMLQVSCVMTLYLLKEQLQAFLSVPVTQK